MNKELLNKEDSLSKDFQYILDNYNEEKRGNKKIDSNSEVWLHFNNIKNKLNRILSLNNKDWILKPSMGQGVKTDYPWISLLNTNITRTTQDGVYICYLFKKDMSGFYLTLMQGVTHYEQYKNNKYKFMNQVTSYFKNELSNSRFNDSLISLNSTKGDRGNKYEKATIISQLYLTNNFNDEQLLKDINDMLNIYKDIVQHISKFSYDEVIKSIIGSDLDRNLISANEAIQKIRDTFKEQHIDDHDINKTLIEQIPYIDRTQRFKKVTEPLIKKIDYFKMAKTNALNGEKGEILCMQYEIERLKLLGRDDLAENIKQQSAISDAYGYNILSYDIDANGKEYQIHIEVKTTDNKIDTSFFVSKNELDKSKEYKKTYCLFRIYDLKNEKPKFYRVFGEIEDNFEIDPVTYKATYKYPRAIG